MRTALMVSAAMASSAAAAFGQNIVDGTGEREAPTAAPIKLTESEALQLVARMPVRPGKWDNPEAERVAAKLEAHVVEYLDGAPWRPFLFTHGIAGYEAHFGHPDEVFHVLSFALPYLSDKTQARVKGYLAELLKTAPPWREAGFDPATGRVRERWDVPERLRPKEPARGRGLFGIYAFWEYCKYAGDEAAAKEHWRPVKVRAAALLAAAYAFDPAKREDRKDDAERLNGDLAGLLGLLRLARINGDAETEAAAAARLTQLLELRINLDRVNPRILTATDSTSSRLHVFKVARHCGLVPEVGAALAARTEGLAAKRLADFRARRNGWWIAFGDRLVGGENWTNPPHLPRSLFAGAALVENVPAADLLAWIDVPWCRGDLWFIERCTLSLWAASGRGWE